jgi:hypothetical protein
MSIDQKMRELGEFERWSLPQTLAWVATREEPALTDQFNLRACEEAWPALAAVLAAGKLSGIGSAVADVVGFSMGFSGVQIVENGLRFPSPESPGFPLTAKLLKRADRNGGVWLDVYDPKIKTRIGMRPRERWWSAISFLRTDIVGAFPSNSRQSKRGPKPKYQPEKVRSFIFKQMGYHGDFDPGDVEWRGEANLVNALVTEFGMAESTAKASLKEHLAAWRRERADI